MPDTFFYGDKTHRSLGSHIWQTLKSESEFG